MMRAWPVLLAVVLLAVPAALAQDEAPEKRRVRVNLTDQGCPSGPNRFCVLPSRIQVDEGRTLVLEVQNTGRVRHNLTAASESPDVLAKQIEMAPLAPNGTATVRLTWETLLQAREAAGSANLTLACGFDGHAALGERLTLTVGEPSQEQPQPAPGAAWLLLGGAAAALALARRRG